MNSKTYERQITRDVDKVRKDLSKLKDAGVSELNRRFDRLAVDARKTASTTAKTINEGIGQGLSTYNSKVQEVVDRVPGDIGRKAAGYPWVTITATLVLGLLLGAIIKPSR